MSHHETDSFNHLLAQIVSDQSLMFFTVAKGNNEKKVHSLFVYSFIYFYTAAKVC